MNEWQQLCRYINMNEYDDEVQYEADFIKWLTSIFGWAPSNIRRQVPVYMGKETKRADIVIYDNERADVVIEMKHQSVALRENEEGQIRSYMTFLRSKLGLLIGNRVLVYYDEKKEGVLPVLLIDIPFDNNNKQGDQFVSLLHYSSHKDSSYNELCIELAKTVIEKPMLSTSQSQQLLSTNHNRDCHRCFWQFFAQYLNGYNAESNWTEWVMKHPNKGDNKLLIPLTKKNCHSNVFLHPIIASNYIRAGIVIDLFTIKNSSKESTKAVFSWLYKRKDEIEEKMEEKLIWESKDQNAQSIYIRNNKLSRKESDWNDTSGFFCDQLERFYLVFKPLIEEYYAQLD